MPATPALRDTLTPRPLATGLRKELVLLMVDKGYKPSEAIREAEILRKYIVESPEK